MKKGADRGACYRVLHEREPCIGCGSCAAVFPQAWSMAADGKATLAGAVPGGREGFFELWVEDARPHEEVAGLCPVSLIRVDRAQDRRGAPREAAKLARAGGKR